MKQVTQWPRDGRIAVVDVPLRALRPGWALVASYYSVISPGTERGKIVLGQKNMRAKARARPDLVRKVVEHARTDGAGTALSARQACRELDGGRRRRRGGIPRQSRLYRLGPYERETRRSSSFYAEHGRDLPAGYVRWTEQRNLQALFVDLLATGGIDPSALTTHRFPVDPAAEAYAGLSEQDGEGRPFGVLREYGERALEDAAPRARTRAQGLRVAVIGAGAFARSKLLPLLNAKRAVLTAVSISSGLLAADVALRFGVQRTAESGDEILGADDVQAVVIGTRDGSHAAPTASNADFAWILSRAFPDAAFVHLVSDGRAVVASIMDMDWGSTEIGGAARYWLTRIASVSLPRWATTACR